jgi:predicted DNA-binding protein with PD1-like motif
LEEEQNQLSLVAVLVAALRKSMVACRVDRGDDVMSTIHHMANQRLGAPWWLFKKKKIKKKSLGCFSSKRRVVKD